MSNQLPTAQSKIGNDIRKEVARLRAERQEQITAMSRILSAASKIAINYDRLVQEVVEMVEDDL